MGWLPVPDPIAFTVFGISIRWYAICITVGMMLSLWIACRHCPKKGLSSDRFLDYFLWCAPAGIIGARLYYVIFKWSDYKDDLGQIFNIRGGGLAIHGGLIAAFLTMYLVAKHANEDPLDWIDITAMVFPLGQAIGRWGNYFNSEAHGTATTLPWAIYADGEWVHPTFLYESVWCLLLFIFLYWWSSTGRTKFKGQIVCFYMIFYSLERVFVEGLRTDSLYLGPFRQAQLISGAIMIAGIILYFVFKKADEKKRAGASDTVLQNEQNEKNA